MAVGAKWFFGKWLHSTPGAVASSIRSCCLRIRFLSILWTHASALAKSSRDTSCLTSALAPAAAASADE